MRNPIQPIIQRIGETDQLYLQGNTAELAQQRAELRLELVTLSQLRQEQIHFLQEAIVLLEQARIEFEELPLKIFVDLSLHLAKAYMMYYEITKEQKFALVTQQIIKPLAHYQHGDIYFFLAYAAAVQQQPALTRHWLSKYSQTAEFDFNLLQQHPAFMHEHQSAWFIALVKQKMH